MKMCCGAVIHMAAPFALVSFQTVAIEALHRLYYTWDETAVERMLLKRLAAELPICYSHYLINL